MNQTLSFIFFFVPGISDYNFSVPHVTWNGLDAGSAFPYSARSRASLTLLIRGISWYNMLISW